MNKNFQYFQDTGFLYMEVRVGWSILRAHPHISFYNPVAAKVGQVTFD